MVLTDIKEYTELLYRDPSLGETRKLFVDFFCNENNLIQKLEDLRERARAHAI